jgi:hypothetical protein
MRKPMIPWFENEIVELRKPKESNLRRGIPLIAVFQKKGELAS